MGVPKLSQRYLEKESLGFAMLLPMLLILLHSKPLFLQQGTQISSLQSVLQFRTSSSKEKYQKHLQRSATFSKVAGCQ